jgi:hypothetical protein
LFNFWGIIVHRFTRRNCVAHVGTIFFFSISPAERCSSASRIAPIEVGYLVATESGKFADGSDGDALQKEKLLLVFL